MKEIPRGELRLLAGAIALGVLLRVVFVYATRHQSIQGDEVEYNLEARFIAHGKWFWRLACRISCEVRLRRNA